MISTHALREEGDGAMAGVRPCTNHFYPRPPRGGRPVGSAAAARQSYFYPRPPRGGRPLHSRLQRRPFRFLPTPSARRATRAEHQGRPDRRDFYPRPPRGGRHACASRGDANKGFLPTPSARRATCPLVRRGGRRAISTHALREEGDPFFTASMLSLLRISTHALREEGD